MRIRERYELADELAPSYRQERRRERGEILDGCWPGHRVLAQARLAGTAGGQRIPPKRRTSRARRYGLQLRRILKVCWEATGPGSPPNRLLPLPSADEGFGWRLISGGGRGAPGPRPPAPWRTV
jgi:hypothetical protein